MDRPLDDGELLALLREHVQRIKASRLERDRLLQEARNSAREKVAYRKLEIATGLSRQQIDNIVHPGRKRKGQKRRKASGS